MLAIFSDHGILRAETMRFPDEVRSPKEIGLPEKKNVSPATAKKFETLISKKAKKEFKPANDVQTEQLLKLVKKKQAKRSNIVEVKDEEPPAEGNVVDMMEVLKRSLAGKRK